MELLLKIDGEAVTVYQPDALSLEAHPLKFRAVQNGHWEAPAPHEPDMTLRLIKHDTGRIHLVQVGRIRIDSTKDYWSSVPLTVFNGWTYSKAHFTTLLELLRWMPAAAILP